MKYRLVTAVFRTGDKSVSRRMVVPAAFTWQAQAKLAITTLAYNPEVPGELYELHFGHEVLVPEQDDDGT